MEGQGGGNKIGEQIMDPRVNIYTDPWNPEVSVLPWDGEGLPRERAKIIDNGKVANLEYSRYWASIRGSRP